MKKLRDRSRLKYLISQAEKFTQLCLLIFFIQANDNKNKKNKLN